MEEVCMVPLRATGYVPVFKGHCIFARPISDGCCVMIRSKSESRVQ